MLMVDWIPASPYLPPSPSCFAISQASLESTTHVETTRAATEGHQERNGRPLAVGL